MKTIVGKLKGNCNLDAYAKIVNNGRTDGTYFYINQSDVIVCNPHIKLSEETQIKELNWFLKGKEYEIKYEY